MLTARNPRFEAQQLVGDGFAARVLEPSPPAVSDEWYADDPVAAGDSPDAPVVSPVHGADLTWNDWLRDHPEHSTWAAARWLGTYRRLPQPPPSLPATRLAMHRVAVYVVSPARRRANGKIALRWTLGGLGTPFFGDDMQVRIAGHHVVRQRGDDVAAEAVTSLAAAADLVLGGPPDVAWAEPFDVPAVGDPHEELAIDSDAAAFLGDWYGFGYSVLEELRSDAASTDPNRVQLWPEHFDAAFDCLADDRRATFGVSPGDEAVDEPYLYVLPAHFESVAAEDIWNADAFSGAVLRLSEFVDAPDQRDAALSFLRGCRDVLRGDQG